MIDRAIRQAVLCHKGQKDKAGKPYILHPLAVMSMVDTEDEMAVAVLHDVLEDSNIPVMVLRERFPKRIVDAVKVLTRKRKDSYSEYLAKMIESGNQLAIKVKMADLKHNMRLTRLPNITQADRDRSAKYAKALSALRKVSID